MNPEITIKISLPDNSVLGGEQIIQNLPEPFNSGAGMSETVINSVPSPISIGESAKEEFSGINIPQPEFIVEDTISSGLGSAPSPMSNSLPNTLEPVPEEIKEEPSTKKSSGRNRKKK